MASRRLRTGARRERFDGAADHRHRPLTLHAHVGDGELEPEPAELDLVDEVVPRRRADARDDTDTERNERQPERAVAVVEPFGDEPADQLVAGDGDLAQRVAGIDPAHLQPEATGRRVEVGHTMDADLHAVAEAEAVLLEQRAQPGPGVGEELDVDRRLRLAAVVGEREVGVPAALLPTLDLAADPHAVVEAPPQGSVDRRRELTNGVGGIAGIVEPEIEGRLAHAAILARPASPCRPGAGHRQGPRTLTHPFGMMPA